MKVRLKKSEDKSFFVRCHYDSTLSRKLFTDTPKYRENDVVVLQIQMIVEGFLIIELLKV